MDAFEMEQPLHALQRHRRRIAAVLSTASKRSNFDARRGFLLGVKSACDAKGAAISLCVKLSCGHRQAREGRSRGHRLHANTYLKSLSLILAASSYFS